jgi:hypothetical protein
VRALLVLALLALGLAACDSSEPGERAQKPPRSETAAAPAPPPPTDAAPPRADPSPQEQLIQAWLAALALQDYRKAASYFAPNALIHQGAPLRLKSRAAAISFNRNLPCSAHLTDVVDEGRTTLATFLLSAGPGGPCEGSVEVRFTIRKGKFVAWRQLLHAPTTRGIEARAEGG